MGSLSVGPLLFQLCIQLGFCLPSEAQAPLVEVPSDNVDAFMDAVLIAEGPGSAVVREADPARCTRSSRPSRGRRSLTFGEAVLGAESAAVGPVFERCIMPAAACFA